MPPCRLDTPPSTRGSSAWSRACPSTPASRHSRACERLWPMGPGTPPCMSRTVPGRVQSSESSYECPSTPASRRSTACERPLRTGPGAPPCRWGTRPCTRGSSAGSRVYPHTPACRRSRAHGRPYPKDLGWLSCRRARWTDWASAPARARDLCQVGMRPLRQSWRCGWGWLHPTAGRCPRQAGPQAGVHAKTAPLQELRSQERVS
mmetsp:Transcript_16791/g.34192  ORF Transcript_16791/g.34192 Transcript_16791/m.34192 type:complete len:205 (+) Transcript_16791:381-995(+)